MPRVTTRDTTYGSEDNKTIPGSDLWKIGIEFEYPVAQQPAHAPATEADYSGVLRDTVGYNRWDLSDYDDGGAPAGQMTRDHTGAEIVSDIMDLHSNHPSDWYRATIAKAEAMGHPFAGCATGATNFGLHMHVSDLSDENARAIRRHITEPWARTFFCASITSTSLDPWRHGGIGRSEFREYNDPTPSSSNRRQSSVNHYNDQHYELRLFEPGVPEHVDLMLRYLQLFEIEGPEEAEQFARELVHTGDPRLTPVQQATLYAERRDGWPNERVIETNDDSVWFYENVFEPHIA